MPSDLLIVFRTKAKDLDRLFIRRFAQRVSLEVAEGGSFCCAIASDKLLRELNLRFRGKDMPTDVLSFPSPSPSGYLGDLAISFDRAAAQAAEHGHSVENEIGILLLHGVLHLLGHDHETDRGRMRRIEAAWRVKLGLPAGLIERSATKRSRRKPTAKRVLSGEATR